MRLPVLDATVAEGPTERGVASLAARESFAMIVTAGLVKRYGRVTAVEDVSLEIKPGEVYGLLGPNGSGKTTTIRILLGLLKPTSGRASVFGLDAWKQSLEVRRRVAYLPGELRLYQSMRGLDFLKFLSGLRGGVGLDRAVAIADRVMELDLRRRIRNYSTGMKQKLALAQVFAEPVEALILDEPTSALDPSARMLVLSLVNSAKASGQTVIFSGHVLPEVEQVADRVAIMRQGRLMHVEDMHARRQGLRLVLARFEGQPPYDFPDELGLTVRERPSTNTVLFEHRGPAAPLLTWLGARGVADIAIGTDGLKALYDRYHGPNAGEENGEAPGKNIVLSKTGSSQS